MRVESPLLSVRSHISEHWDYLITPGAYKGADLVRAVAILSVLLFHAVVAPDSLFNLGWIGVDIFFVLSGFLIGGVIINDLGRENFRFGKFYKRRFLRILPLYYAVTAITMFLASRTTAKAATAGDYVFNGFISAFFLQTFAMISPSRYNPYMTAGGTWSLVIEEFFYLICPLGLVLLFKIFKKDLRKVGWFVVVIIASGPLVHLAAYLATTHMFPGNQSMIFLNFILPHSRYDELAAGVLIAILIRLVTFGWRAKAIMMLVSASMFAAFAAYMKANPAALNNPPLLTWETVVLPTWFSLMIGTFFLAIHDLSRSNVVVTVIAKLSYPIYLFQFLTFPLFVLIAPSLYVGGIPQNWSVTLLLAYLASLLIEYPFLRLYKGPSRKRALRLTGC